MQTVSYKCPCCGSALKYSGDSHKLECASCGNVFEADAVEALAQSDAEDQNFGSVSWSMEGQSYGSEDESQTNSYTCSFCGAELLTDAGTTATQCAYCGSPAILPARLQGGVRPEKVVPFKITQAEATKIFNDYFKGKRLIPNVFETSKNRIAEIRQLYVPYWLFSCDVNAHVLYDASQVEIRTVGGFEETRTRHFLVRRAGTVSFDDIPVDGSTKLDDKITESIEPYDISEAIDFAPAVLSGAQADRADVDADACRERATERLTASTENAFRETVEGYSSVSVRRSSIRTKNGTATPVLLPVWLITTRKTEKGKEKTYTFAINGQTGQLACDVPYSKSKSAKWFCGLTAGIAAAGYVVSMILAAVGVLS